MNIEQQIYTSCPQGKGYDGISGFQVKARSPGITDSISKSILRYSNHYRVPRKLRQSEYQYYQNGQDLPLDFLSQFPVVVTYHHIEGNFYGLTRINYRGKDYSGRPGNFYAHTLVFEPEALKSFDYNPIMLTHSGVFEASLDNDSTVLEPLTDLDRYVSETSSPIQDRMANICREPYKTSYAAILPAFVQQFHLERPIILCFKEYVEAADYIEALLMLLPSETRCRITFTTYEPDPYAIIKRAGRERTTDNLHLITTVEREVGGAFEFRPHELTQFLVWDFAGQHYSEFPTSSPYTHTMLQLCIANQFKELKDNQEFLIQLGAGRMPDVWDALILAKGLDKKLTSAEAHQVAPLVLESLLKVAKTEPQVTHALNLVWPLLHRAALRETEEFFSSTQKAFDQLLDRLPLESSYREHVREQVITLISQAVVSGAVSRARALVGLDQFSLDILFSEVAYQLTQQGWPEISAQTQASELSQTLETLQSLAQEPEMIVWVVQTLWQKVKLLAEASSPEDYFSQSVITLSPLITKLPQTSNLRREITTESEKFVHPLLAKGFPARAFKMFKLSGQNIKLGMPKIYNALVAEEWPTTVQVTPVPRSEDQEAFMTMLSVVVETILSEPIVRLEFERLVPAFRGAMVYGVADKLWFRFKDALIKRISNHSDCSAAISFVETIRELLEPYGCPREIFDLLFLQTKIRVPDTLEQWKARVSTLTQFALRGAVPVEKIDELFKHTTRPLTHQEQVVLLAVMFQKAIGHVSIQATISQKYRELLKASNTFWEVRSALAEEGDDTRKFLTNDFLESLTPWPKDGAARLQAWREHIFFPYPETIPVASMALARWLQEEQDLANKLPLVTKYLSLFDEQFARQCGPLLTAFISKAPIETVAANWKPWFSQVDLSKEGLSQASKRARLLAWAEQIEAAQIVEPLDVHKAFGYLQEWQKLRQGLDSEAGNWASERLLEFLTPVDLSSVSTFQTVVQNSLYEYSNKDFQAAVNYVVQQYYDDLVGLVLLLIVLSQTGMNNIANSDGEKLADVVSGVLNQLPTSKRDLFWQQLSRRAEQSEPPATEMYQRFRKMTTPTVRFGRVGSRLIKRFLGRKKSGTSLDKTREKNTE